MLIRLLTALGVTVAAPAILLGWLALSDSVAERIPLRHRRQALAVLWLLPASTLMGVVLLWPLLDTTVVAFRGAEGTGPIGLANVRWLLESDSVRQALANNVLWVAGLVFGCLLLGLIVAVLADQVRYESVAKAVIVVPTAISFVCGAVIWGFMYDYQAPGLPQIGTLNGGWADALGQTPVAWLVNRATNNYALVAIGLWSTLGFAAVILSAALKGVPIDIVEAARIDGASGWQVFRHIVFPQLVPTLVVVATLVGIMALNAFDIVYVLTNGNFGTDVIANVLYTQLFVAQNPGRASAVALLLTVLTVPFFLANAWVIRSQRINT